MMDFRELKKVSMKTRFRLLFQLWILPITFFTTYSSSSFATITEIEDSTRCRSPCWEISGLIAKSDLRDLARAVETMNKNKNSGKSTLPYFRLNSNGGDVETAIAIGRQLRNFHATAVAWQSGGCYSSCVFIFAGAVQRAATGSSIGIHRPYSTSTELRDFKTIQNDQRRIAKLAKDYLEEMNVLPSLYDAMVSVPPEKIRMLSEAELDQYGLSQTDPAEQEFRDAAEARRRGLTKVEFIRRKAQVNINCASAYKYGTQTSNFDGYFKCEKDILNGER